MKEERRHREERGKLQEQKIEGKAGKPQTKGLSRCGIRTCMYGSVGGTYWKRKWGRAGK